MSKISIKYRIMLVAAVAMFGMIAIALMLLLDENADAREMVRLESIGILSTVVSSVVHEMQKERGMSAGFIGSNGKSFAADLLQQRNLTDIKRSDLRSSLADLDAASFGYNLVAKIKIANSTLGKIDVARKDVSNLSLTVQQSGLYFSGAIAKLLSVIEEMGSLSSNADVTRAIASYTNFLQGKDRAGMERAMGAAGFGKGEFSLAIYLNFVKLVGQQEVLFSNFKKYGTSDQAVFYDKTVAGSAVDEVVRMRKIAFESKKTGHVGNFVGKYGHTGEVLAKYWFGELTKKINLMKKVEDHISGDLLRLTSNIHASADIAFRWLVTVVAALVIGTATLVYFIVRGIIGPIQSMTSVMGQLAEGNNKVEIQAQNQGDEIGEMARAVQVFKENAVERVRLEKEEKKAETALRESNERFKGLFENSEISIWNEDFTEVLEAFNVFRQEGVTDLRQHLERNNQVALDLVRKIKVRQVNHASLNLFGAKDKNELAHHVAKFFGSNVIGLIIDLFCGFWDGHGQLRFEVRFKTIEGEDFDAILSLQIPETEGGYESIPVSIIDITDRKKLEKQVRRSQKMEAVGQLTGGIAHDFNNILGIIQGNFEILQRMLVGDDRALSRVETGLKGAARGAELTRKLLNFSGKSLEGVKRISINTFIHDMEDLLAKSLTVLINVNFHLDDDVWLVDVDPGDLQDVIINLALNARDAMPDGGHLVIEIRNKVLDESYSRLNPQGRAGEFVMLSVSDTGCGMTSEVKERVLEPFFTTKEHGKGTGLGLSMVYGFVQRSGGHLKIYSEVGKGTTIRLYLPRAKEQAYQIEAVEDERVNLPSGTETILIVDDEKGLRDIAVFHLEDLGYETITAENGKQALEVLRERRDIDVMFSDIVMPGGLDGYRLALAAHDQHPNLKILLTSGFTKKQAEFNSGEDKYLADLNKGLLSKPYNQAELSIAVRGMIDGDANG